MAVGLQRRQHPGRPSLLVGALLVVAAEIAGEGSLAGDTIALGSF